MNLSQLEAELVNDIFEEKERAIKSKIAKNELKITLLMELNLDYEGTLDKIQTLKNKMLF